MRDFTDFTNVSLSRRRAGRSLQSDLRHAARLQAAAAPCPFCKGRRDVSRLEGFTQTDIEPPPRSKLRLANANARSIANFVDLIEDVDHVGP